MNILIKNIDIITSDSSKMYIKNGNIGIKDGIIDFVEDKDDCIKKFNADKIIYGKDRLALPGLVNTHTHCAMTLLRNFADDMALEEWLFKKIFPAENKLTDEDVYWGTLLGIAEMIKSGTTAFADMYFHMDAVAEAVSMTGIRANLSKSPLKFNVGVKSETIDVTKDCIKYFNNWNGKANGKIKVSIEVHSAYLYSEKSLINASELAKELNTGIQIHILETERERKESILKYGMNSAEICLKTGIFDVPVIAAHCVHLTDSDMDIFKSKGVNVSHNPTSNLKLGSGIARISEMLNREINVALGTDGTASNNNLNMFEEMNLSALLHKGVNMNPLLVNSEQAIKMATSNGAKAIGFEKEVGVIKKGMKADIIIIDTAKAHLTPINNPLSALVYSAQGSDVDTVLIDGEILMENRILKTIDEELVRSKVNEISKKIIL
jgi:5-methylthioadenosine/S-adenosylhomocysteine deaminase